MNIICIICLPILGALIVPLLGLRSKALRNWTCLLLVAVPLLLVFTSFGQTDAFALFMAFVSLFVSSVIMLYSFDYIDHYAHQNEYYFMVMLFIGSMMGLVFSANLILLFVFWELTALTSWRLIGFYRENEYLAKANKAFLVTGLGALCMLLGFLIIFQQTGTFDLRLMQGLSVPGLAMFLILAGIFSKSATLPLQTWLPDAGVAPSPVTALLHAAVLVKIGVYFFARLFVFTFVMTPFWQQAVLYVAAASALISGFAALREYNLKRLIAYSTISQIAFIFLGFAIDNRLGIAGAALYILMHGLAKGGLFLCAGIVEQNSKTKDISKLGGLFATMPFTAIAFLFCAFSVMGIPPFGGFFAKFMVLTSVAQTQYHLIAGLFIFGAVLTMLYLFRAFNLVFLGEQKIKAQEASPLMVSCVMFLAIMSLLAGVFINYPLQFVGMFLR